MIADFILAGMAAEGLALAALRAATGRGPKRFGANLAAGAGLLIAWRTSEAGASYAIIAMALAAAGIAHGLDLASRWRESPRELQIANASIRVRAVRRQAP